VGCEHHQRMIYCTSFRILAFSAPIRRTKTRAATNTPFCRREEKLVCSNEIPLGAQK
jgi:hypothetical protein